MGTSCAPSVLIIFINMMLFKESNVKEPCQPLMYDGQDAIQKLFLAVAFLCIPVMLFGKPVYQLMVARKNKVRFCVIMTSHYLLLTLSYISI